MTTENSRRGQKIKATIAAVGLTLLVFAIYASLVGAVLFSREAAAEFGYGLSEEVWLALALVVTILACPLALLALYFIAGRRRPGRLRLAFHPIRGRHLVSLLKYFSIHVGLLIVFGTIIEYFGLEHLVESSEEDVTDFLLLGPWLPLLLLAVAVPIFEESLFRGFLYARLRLFAGFWPAFLVSGLLFSLLHVNLELALPQNVFVVTLIFGLTFFITKTFEETRNLWMPIIFHGLHNGMIVFLVLIAQLLEERGMLT